MTDINELADRLRSMSRHEHDDLSIGYEAATALTDLQAKLRATEPTIPPPTCPSIDKAIAALEELRLDNSQLRYGIGYYQVLNDELKAALSRLKALLAEAGEAVKPFQKLNVINDRPHVLNSGAEIPASNECLCPVLVKLGDLRRAANVMEKINAVK